MNDPGDFVATTNEKHDKNMSHKKALILLECTGLSKGIPIMGYSTPYNNGQHKPV